MSGRKKLLIHAGMHKTGSSAIQNSLYSCKGDLNRSDVDYPDSGIVIDSDIGTRHLYFSKSFTPSADGNFEIDRFINEMLALPCSQLVVSHEDIFRPGVNAIVLEKLYLSFDLLLVVYVKEPVSYINDKYKEWVRRVGYGYSPGQFLTDHIKYLDFQKILAPWLQYVCKDNIMIVPYFSPTPEGRSVVTDFWARLRSIFDVPVDYLDEGPRIHNKSTSNYRTKVQAEVNLSYPYHVQHPAFRSAVERFVQREEPKGVARSILLKPADVDLLLAKTAQGFDYLRSEFDCEVDLPAVQDLAFDSNYYDQRVTKRIRRKLFFIAVFTTPQVLSYLVFRRFNRLIGK